tara:strand:- start:123 stop:281 length:159 start_codon:yes stop_codon:yes gene_type:complete
MAGYPPPKEGKLFRFNNITGKSLITPWGRACPTLGGVREGSLGRPAPHFGGG